MLTIQPPTHCPSCNYELEWVNHLLYCKNSSCPAQSSKKVEHFSKTLKIKGLGPVAIEKLGLTYLPQIFTMTLKEIAEGLGSERLAEKLYAEIGNAITVSLNRLLPAFSIPLVGNSASRKLAAVCDTLDDITQETCKEAGLGDKTTNNLVEWIEYNYDLIEELPFSFKFEKPKSTRSLGVVCISGRLKSYKTKAEATTVLEGLGYSVKSSLTKDVTILVNESGIDSAKTKTATQRGITIVTNLLEFIGE